MRTRILLMALIVLGAAAPASAQTLLENGLTIQRNVTGIPLNSPFGMDVDPTNGDLYFIANNGADIYVLRSGGQIEPIITGVGPFRDGASDLRLGPDRFLYAIGPGDGFLTAIDRISLQGQRQPTGLAVVSTPQSAYGLDFDCVGQMYFSDNGPDLFRVDTQGFMGIHSEGWDDVDEVEQGPDSTMFVHHAQRDRVFLVRPDGTRTVYVSGLANITTGAYDWGSGDYLVADTTGGNIYRLHDLNRDLTIQPQEVTLLARGFPAIGDINWGVSSHNPRVFSLYVGIPTQGRIFEITGFPAPPGGAINCGDFIDDDGDRWCEFGFDANGDGDCEDEFEEQPVGDCNDANPTINPDATELCDDLDNDCNPDTPDGASDPLFGRPCDGNDLDLCPEGFFFCARGQGIRCDDATRDSLELCDGEDNDCNPDTPDGFDEPTFGLPCDGNDRDLCPEGTVICQGGDLSCDDDTDDTPDLCDGEDDDCNPQTPDGSTDPRVNQPCDGPDQDRCPEGTFTCDNGVPSCSDDTDDDLDLCDNVDNDCDPDTPDGVDEPTFGQRCDGPDNDACEEGEIICASGLLLCDDPTDTVPDLCDGEDNDCNPDTPDGSGDARFGQPCDGNDDDACPDGRIVCNGVNLICDDDDVSIAEICNDGIDNDCDGNADDADGDCRGSLDVDGDGFCIDGEDLNNDGDCVDPGEEEGRRDCNDFSSNINPDAVEQCRDRLDNDCDGLFDLEDPDCGRVLDVDEDGYCGQGQDLNDDGDCLDDGEDNGQRDCDEERAEVNSGAQEVCDDGLDNDCDGDTDAADDACPDVADRDGDGFCPLGRDGNGDGDCLDDGEGDGPGDCDDDAAAIFPGAEEVCGDGVDSDCGETPDDEDAACQGLVDNDGDGFCEEGRDGNGDGDCFDPDEEGDAAVDCDDAAATSNPAAREICNDGADNDCDGDTDEADADCAGGLDGDGDGVCTLGRDDNGDGDCLDDGENIDLRDCNDDDATIFPGAEEICGDNLDNDCDELVDAADDACDAVADRDGDEFCPQGRDLNEDGDCLDPGEANGESDCNEDDFFIHPDARERCDDNIDNDCDGAVDLDDDDCAPEDDDDQDVPAPKKEGCAAAAPASRPAGPMGALLWLGLMGLVTLRRRRR